MSKIIKQPYHLTVASTNYNLYEERILLKIQDRLQYLFSRDTSIKDFVDRMSKRKRARELLLLGEKIDVVTKQLKMSKADLKNLNISKEDHVIDFKVKDLMLQGTKKYKKIEEALRSLMKNQITLKGSDRKFGKYKMVISLISHFCYFEKKELVRIKISDEVMACLCASLSNYTKFSLDIAFKSKSPYIIRIYKYISHWRDRAEKEPVFMDVNILRRYLGINNKYTKTASIKQKIIDPAIKVLEEKADVWFKINETVVEGRKVTGWLVSIFVRKENTHRELIADTTKLPANQSNNTQEPPKEWDKFRQGLKALLNENDYKTWIAPLSFVSLIENLLTVEAPNKFLVEQLEAKFLEKIRKSVKSTLGQHAKLAYQIKSQVPNVKAIPQEPITIETLEKTYGLSMYLSNKIFKTIAPEDIKKTILQIKKAKQQGKIHGDIGAYTAGTFAKKFGMKL